MKNSQGLFLIFCLILVVGLMRAYDIFKEYFGDEREYQKQVLQLRKDVERERLVTSLVQDQFIDFRQSLAGLLPDETLHGMDVRSYKLRQLEVSLRAPASQGKMDLSAVLMAKGKETFGQKQYNKSAVTFAELIEKYPLSSQVVEAHFLLAESYFLSHKLESCLDEIEQMMTQYPESELTGFIMLRQGQILEARKKSAEAAEVFRTVIRQFKTFPQLKAQAEKLLQLSGA